MLNWAFPLSVMPWSSIQVLAGINSSFFYTAELYFLVLLSNSLMEGHLSLFSAFWLLHSKWLGTIVFMFYVDMSSLLWDRGPGVKQLGHMINMYSVVRNCQTTIQSG